MLYILLRRHSSLFKERGIVRRRRNYYPRGAIKGTLTSKAREMLFLRKGSCILGLYSNYYGTGYRPQEGRGYLRIVSTD